MSAAARNAASGTSELQRDRCTVQRSLQPTADDARPQRVGLQTFDCLWDGILALGRQAMRTSPSPYRHGLWPWLEMLLRLEPKQHPSALDIVTCSMLLCSMLHNLPIERQVQPV